jgi:hypothetical protein
MSKRTFTWLGESITACICNCHVVGSNIKHCFACCDVCYEHYIVAGKIDQVLLDAALERTYAWRKKQNEK